MTIHTAQTSQLIYARVAGFTFLLYIAAGITSLAVGSQASVTDLLSLLMSLSAVVLGVTLYALTRAQEPILAMLALTCRLLEATAINNSSIFFAIASTIFSGLLLRGRLIPVALAWLGVIASALLVLILPLQVAGLLGGTTSWSASITWLIWLPMLVFEVTLAFWLLIKGVAMPAPTRIPARADSVLP